MEKNNNENKAERMVEKKRYRECEACPGPIHGFGFIAVDSEIGVFWGIAIMLRGREVHYSA